MDKTEKPNERLKRQRELKGWSQAKLAKEVGATQKMVSRWESGVSKPQPYYREKLIETFEMNAWELGLLDFDIVPDEDDRKTNSLRETLYEHHAGSTSSSNNQSIQIIISTDRPTVTVQLHQQAIIHASDHPIRNDMITEEIQISPILGRDDSEKEMDRKRRELLRFLGIASGIVLLPFPDMDWERVIGALKKPSQLDTTVIQDFEAINNRYWHLYVAAASKSLVLDGVLGQFKMLVHSLKEPHTAHMHQHLCILSSDLSQLAGEIFFDRHEHKMANSCYAFAMSTAKEAKAIDLWASALVRSSFLPLYEERYDDALSFLRQAQSLAQLGDSSISTRYWVAAVEAEAESGVGNLNACQSALERASEVQAIDGSSPAWLRFDGSRLPALRGACYVRLNQPGLALPALLQALQQFSQPTRKRGLALTDSATIAIQGREIEQACTYVSEVIDIVEMGSSDFLRKEVHKLFLQLEPFSEIASVKTLEQKLSMLA